MRIWALTEIGDAEAIELFLSYDAARRALDDCIRDEPEWRELLRVTELELLSASDSKN